MKPKELRVIKASDIFKELAMRDPTIHIPNAFGILDTILSDLTNNSVPDKRIAKQKQSKKKRSKKKS